MPDRAGKPFGGLPFYFFCKKKLSARLLKTIRTVFLFCGLFLFRIHGKTDVLLSVVYEAAVPVFEGGKKGVSAVVVIRFLCPE